MKEYWGYHLIVDCQECDLDKVKDRQNIIDFVKNLVDEIDMTAYGKPIVEHFATHNPLAAGHSLVQLIETSSITGHFVDLNGEAYIDIFSCKQFEIETAKAVIQKHFEPKKMKITYLTRQA